MDTPYAEYAWTRLWSRRGLLIHRTVPSSINRPLCFLPRRYLYLICSRTFRADGFIEQRDSALAVGINRCRSRGTVLVFSRSRGLGRSWQQRVQKLAESTMSIARWETVSGIAHEADTVVSPVLFGSSETSEAVRTTALRPGVPLLRLATPTVMRWTERHQQQTQIWR